MAYILLAEDDQFLADGLSRTLRHGGHKVDSAKNGIDAEAAVFSNVYDLLILDIGLPQRDGLTVLENLRREGKSLPVLILTARDTPEDRILGLDRGANDYLCKPFNVGELEARIRALLRKEKWANQVTIRVGTLSLDTLTNKFSIDDQPLDLSAREYLVLELMLQRRGRVVFKNDLIEHLASLERDMSSNALDIVIHRLRKKIDHSGCLIQTVKGLGFIIE
ncbi:MAG: response regulator transcription factor [Cyanobacteria bacterium SZAS LIN-2]|nr:response regulator transcription factor [Cyanobacteria bacterium SZAS LIN-3]MBS1997106.1 response regulator transcription factor [Cyanobacteria bacterium SZAS LIN-2]MBS2008714.1 response regulator transcription factor [Cyanobacteria bacterium SZAS TMP-1]